MKHLRSIPAFVFLACSLVLAAGWAALPVNAQDSAAPKAGDPAQAGSTPGSRDPGGRGARIRRRGPNGRGPMAGQRGQGQQIRQLRMIDRLSKMSPAERERLLSNLPPQRRRMVEENLKRFEKLPPERRAALLERLGRLDAMTPERRAHFRELLREVSRMPDARRRVLQREFRRIQRMPDEERLDYTASKAFRDELTEPERQLVLDLVETAPEP